MRPLALAVAATLALPPAPLLAAGAATPPPAAARAKALGGAEEPVTLNFVNADIDAAVRAIGQYTGRQFVIDPRVKGTLTLVTERPVTKQQAYEQLLSALRLQGFTLVEAPGGIARVLPEADAKLQGGRVLTPQDAQARGDQIVTQVFELQHESATNLVPVLRPLIAPNNTISAYAANNSLIITDYAENLRRIRDIIAAIDRPSAAEGEIIQLKHGIALEIATVANRVLEESARAAGQATDAGQRVTVLAEPRTNAVILRSPSRQRANAARQLIARLDQPSVTPGNINVVYLRNAQAARLAQTLRAVISADPSFTPQAGGTGGLSASSSAFGGQAGLQGQPGQPVQPPQAQQQQLGGGGGGGGGVGGGGGGALAGMIQADVATNSLIITAPEPLYRNIRTIIEKLDVRPAQVIIESLIAEVSADKAAEFGVQWQALGGLRESNGNQTSVIGGTNFGGPTTNIISAAQNPGVLGPGMNIGVVSGRITLPGIGEVLNLGFLARALESQANANVLSQPNIQTLDNEEAKFLVGQNVPFLTGSFSSAGQNAGSVNPFQTFERRDIGLQLRVKPQISEGGAIRLAIYLEVSAIQPGASLASAGGIITNKRSFESNVVVEDGNFIVLSGLIEDRTNNSEQRVPLLSSIPGIGWLFRFENRERRRTNLMVFLRPVVIRDEAASADVAANRYEYMRTQTQDARKPDNWLLRGYEGNQLPPYQEVKPPTPPRAPQVLTAPSAAPAPPAEAPRGTAPAGAAPAVATGNFAASASSPRPRASQQLLQVMTTSDVARGREASRQLRAAGFDAFVRLFSNDIAPVRLARDLGMATVNRIGPLRRAFMREAGGATGDLPRLLRGELV
jgi:general secretion pathway protein D